MDIRLLAPTRAHVPFDSDGLLVPEATNLGRVLRLSRHLNHIPIFCRVSPVKIISASPLLTSNLVRYSSAVCLPSTQEYPTRLLVVPT